VDQDDLRYREYLDALEPCVPCGTDQCKYTRPMTKEEFLSW
jgi:hypothetical protein